MPHQNIKSFFFPGLGCLGLFCAPPDARPVWLPEARDLGYAPGCVAQSSGRNCEGAKNKKAKVKDILSTPGLSFVCYVVWHSRQRGLTFLFARLRHVKSFLLAPVAWEWKSACAQPCVVCAPQTQ